MYAQLLLIIKLKFFRNSNVRPLSNNIGCRKVCSKHPIIKSDLIVYNIGQSVNRIDDVECERTVTNTESEVNPEGDTGFETAHNSQTMAISQSGHSYPLYDVNGDFEVNNSLIYLLITNSNISYKYSTQLFGKGERDNNI
jgi:hypothetical protein